MPTALDRFRLDGRVALITGGSRGLGKSMGQALAEAGATVLLCSRHADESATAAAELAGLTHAACHGLAADVTDPGQVQTLVDTVLARHGRLDILINSAGINIRHPIEEFPVEEFDRIQAVNVRGTWLCCRAVAGPMKRAGRGAVINVASALGLVGLPDRSAYCTSKAAIVGLTRTLALEWAPSGVRCNALCPGPFMTEINRPLLKDPAKAAQVLNQTAFKRWAELDEIRGAALFLASDASSFVTGAVLAVDGGWTAG